MSERFARNSLFGTLAAVGTALGSFLSMVVVARLLGPVGTGEVAYIVWIVTLATTAADVGVTQTLTRTLPELTARGEAGAATALATSLLRWGSLTVVAGAAGFFALGASGTVFEGSGPPSTWWLVGCLFVVSILSAYGLAILRGLQRFDDVAKLTLLSLVLQIATVAVGAHLYGVQGAVMGYCVGNLLPIVALFRNHGEAGTVDAALRRRAIRFALFAWAGALTTALVWSRLEIAFLQRYHGPEAVAMFTVGFTFANLASQGPLLLTSGLLTFFAESYGRRSTAQMHAVYATATRIMAFLLFPACLGLAAILPALLPLVYGTAYLAAVPVACVLVAGSALGAAGAVGSQMIYACERSDFIFFSGLCGAVLSVTAGFVIIPRFGMMGAALARTAIQAFMLATGCWFIARRLGCPIPFAQLGKLMASAMLCGLCAYACIVTIPHPAVALPTAIGVGAIVYLTAVRAIGALPAEDVARLRTLLGRMPGAARFRLASLADLLSASQA